MKFEHLEIPDLILVTPRVFEDERGFFFESFQEKKFREFGIAEKFVQDNHVSSKAGVFRGLHYQIAPHAQGKLVRVIRGKIYDVAVDIRKNSPTFGRYAGVMLDAEKKQMLYVPAGFAHGYYSFEDGTEVLYKATGFYSKEHERGLLWNDPKVGIDWPFDISRIRLVERDKNFPGLSSAELF